MRRALVDALRAREAELEAKAALVLMPGQEPPEDWGGEVIRIQVKE